MNKILKQLFILPMILLLLISSCDNSYEQSFKKIKKGQTVEQVIKIMGKPEAYEDESVLLIYYWFLGADSREEADKKTSEGVVIKYYCVCFYAEDYYNFKIVDNDHFWSGIWGVN